MATINTRVNASTKHVITTALRSGTTPLSRHELRTIVGEFLTDAEVDASIDELLEEGTLDNDYMTDRRTGRKVIKFYFRNTRSN